MEFRQIPCGGDRNFGYLVADSESKKCALLDPSPDPEPALRLVAESGLDILYVINTHDHYDHTGGNQRVQAVSSAQAVLHRSSRRADVPVDEGEGLKIGALELRVIATPGHTMDSISLLVEDPAGSRLITGDFLFVGKIGGTTGREDALVQFESLKRVMAMDGAITVWPGHDVGVHPSSTIGEERETNPFCLRLSDFEAFYDLKLNWAAYKREHGIG